jgi:hypothetical protein
LLPSLPTTNWLKIGTVGFSFFKFEIINSVTFRLVAKSEEAEKKKKFDAHFIPLLGHTYFCSQNFSFVWFRNGVNSGVDSGKV